ncbi:uncharacterized protein LACBIDRAFT_298859 [Laccaria bicolor S238N-H82]|uniref:Predicted protein n=1 Tax=Laccaria bicolor (strain S238N-H82 / ATCC MYA-4686) TaxID=486041 RepID=B0DE67_LACBS|nr:uncharacterized protein LACBIDRAFT_298859 [Laccaria bicolor S238N-H82]EDR07210.1 predicted protein [Laccaria bicolor S238N-H82]|eukprot:XP_001882141.1 predicted protein [Laccaria bicolor S238N-H82]
MIPRDAYPSSVYSFLNLRNFQFAIKYWLGYALEAKQYDTTSLTNPDTNEQIYRDALTHIQNIMQHQNNNNNKTDPILKLIFQRTLDFLQLRKKISGHVLQNRQGLNSPCKTCNNLPVEEQCIQTIYVDSSKVVDPSVIGCGVSLAPPEIQLEPLKNPHAKPGSQPKPILKPEDPCLKLVRIEPNLQIIERCGLQVFLMCDKTSEETLDFWVYNAFDKDTLCQLVDHHSKLSNVKKINRGKKFESYSMGKMMGHGSRAAMGGASGDSYTFYAGMEAITQEDINALFNSAEDSMVMSEIARLFHHPLYQELKEASAAGDRLGTSGATLYSCNNYTSPLHCDDDATRGLCAQYQLQAISKFFEYSFIFADYGLYFVSRTGSLWSFDGSKAHGTLLPSTSELTEEDRTIYPQIAGQPPIRISNGNHVTRNKKNQNAAIKYQAVRIHRDQIQQYYARRL